MAASRTARLLAAGTAVALGLGACSPADETVERTPPAPTTSAPPAPVACPVGDDVPRVGPSRTLEPVPLPAEAAAPDGASLIVGTLLPRSGDLAFLGAAPIAGAEQAVADLGDAGGVLGSPVGLVHADSAEGAPDVAAAEVDRLLASGVQAVVGPLSSATAAAALERAASTGAVLVTPGATAASLDRLDRDGRLFRTAADEALQGRALAALVLDDGPRRVDIIVRDDEHGQTIADAFATALGEGGGEVVGRVDRDPTAEVGDLGDLDGEATVVIGLAESAPVIDALEAIDRGPRRHPTYGTDGNLGERLGDLVADRRSLTCMRGLLPIAPADRDIAVAVASTAGLDVSELDPAALDHAAEAYDAVVIIALAAEFAGTAEPAAMAAAIGLVTRGGTPCDRPAACLELARAGTDLAYVGRSGRAALDDAGNRTRAVLSLVAFDAEGHLARLGGREVGGPPGT